MLNLCQSAGVCIVVIQQTVQARRGKVCKPVLIVLVIGCLCLVVCVKVARLPLGQLRGQRGKLVIPAQVQFSAGVPVFVRQAQHCAFARAAAASHRGQLLAQVTVLHLVCNVCLLHGTFGRAVHVSRGLVVAFLSQCQRAVVASLGRVKQRIVSSKRRSLLFRPGLRLRRLLAFVLLLQNFRLPPRRFFRRCLLLGIECIQLRRWVICRCWSAGVTAITACTTCAACAAALGSAPDVLGHARFSSELRAAHAAVVCKLFPRLICYFFVRLIPGLVLLCPLRAFFCGCIPFIFPITCSFRVCHFQKLLSKTARPHHAGRACVVFIPFFRPSGFPPRPPCCSSPQRGFFSKILAGARPAPPHFRRCSPAP